MHGPYVLLVDDRSGALRELAAELGRTSQVWTASDGEEALALLDAVCLDVVFTEVRLPRRSGFEVLQRVRERRLATQVVMLTTYANVPDAVAAMRAGAFDYLAKPVALEDLELVVARAVSAGRAPRAPLREAEDGSPAPLKGFHGTVEEARHRASRAYLQALMHLHGGNVTQAAQQAGMTRESLHRALRRFGLGPGHHHPEHAHEAGHDDDPPAKASQGA